MNRIVLAAVLIALGGGCGRPPPETRSAVLVTIDTWRADHLGAGGHPELRTPHLDRFFREATQFTEAYASIPTTLASHASMLSGEWPSGHGVPRNGWPVPEELDTLAEILGRSGFRTGAFVSSAALDPRLNLDQGFDVYDYDTPLAVERDQAWRSAGDTLARAVSWWRGEPGRRFLWVHLFEPHFPYDPDARDRALYETGYSGEANGSMDYLFSIWEGRARLDASARAHLRSLYHAEITGLDRRIGEFLAALREEEATLVIVTSDHGESLGEHGLEFKHGPHVFPGDVRVPLAIRGERPFDGGLTDAIVRTVDLAPTIVRALGVEAELPADARDLASGPRSRTELAFAEASMPWNVEVEGRYANALKQRVVRTPRWSLVVTPWKNQKLWFDRLRDPGEENPVGGPEASVASRLEAELEEWASRGSARPAPRTVDPELIEQIEGLGYIE